MTTESRSRGGFDSTFASDRNPVFFIAEIGGNHEGDFDYAKRLTRLAISAGADAVKFQVYAGDALVSRVESPARNEHFKRFEFSREQYVELAELCQAEGVRFMASVWDEERLAWMDPHIPIHKVGSGDVTAFPLLRRLVATGKPLILSTGLCTMAEVRRTVAFVAGLDQGYLSERKLALLQCTTAYPCPDEDANLDAMLALRDEFGLPVGYSDHTIGLDAALAAATLGAEILEVHFTDSREGRTFRDHAVSATAEEVRYLLERIARMKVLRGERAKRPTQSEIEAGHVTSFRRSIYAARPIRAGERLNDTNVTVLRPEHGVPAYRFDEVLGRRAARDMQAHEVFRHDDFA